jgi:hypothetical protein
VIRLVLEANDAASVLINPQGSPAQHSESSEQRLVFPSLICHNSRDGMTGGDFLTSFSLPLL